MAQPLTLKRRLALITRAADNRRPILIGYEAENPCSRSAGDERTIEVHDIRPTEAGHIVIDAWCRTCRTVERFRLDRVTWHRTLRTKPQGPTPPITPYFCGRRVTKPAEQLDRPPTNKSTAPGLITRARARIHDSRRFHDIFGPHESYPRRTLALTTADLLAEVRGLITNAGQDTPQAHEARFRAVFGSPLAYPDRRTVPTAEDHLRAVREAIAANDRFHAAVADMANSLHETRSRA